ncbi:MAG: 50S ribosomal protein L15 [Thiotrichales bacterium]|nr:50S ribosomal protein L15 [Thiotrichales bacterium]MCY4285117.1 50S ribosomal protein L15 [Thiotrichales bacterium]MCY4351046.1 50S ribosomal protein L15 [Thiotrichales bacterium]
MRLNDIKPGIGAKRPRKRRGRGASSGLGKTGGHGHKGQNSRAGGGVRRGFEGGQMPLQRRLPKFGFSSRKSLVREDVRTIVLEKLEGTDVTLGSLKEAGVISKNVKQVKIFGEAPLSRVYTVTGVPVTKGARSSIERVGGRIED